MGNWILYICLWLGFLSAMVSGVFLSFSDFVMEGLIRSKPASGIESMQQLNRTVFRSIFLTSFLSLVPLTIGFAIFAAAQTVGGGRAFVIAAAITYFVSVFVVTIAGNVPMNKQLDQMEHTSDEAACYWKTYSNDWTRWNHVRTVGATATAAFFLLAGAAFSSGV